MCWRPPIIWTRNLPQTNASLHLISFDHEDHTKNRHALLICAFVQLQTCFLDKIRRQLIQLNLRRIHPFIVCVRFVFSFGKMVTAMCRSGLTWPWHFILGFNSSLVHPWSTSKVRWKAWLLRLCNVFLVDGWHLIPGNIRQCLMKWVMQVRSN